jgi:hypothetical protein
MYVLGVLQVTVWQSIAGAPAQHHMCSAVQL